MNRATRIPRAGLHPLINRLLLLTTVIVTTAGCVSQRYVDDLEVLYRRSQEQILDLRAQLEEKQTEIEVIRSALNSQDPDIHDKLQKAISSHDKLAKALAEAESRLRSIGTGPILEPELDAALVQLSESNPNLMTYDSQMGMVKFQSDLTFALGSTDVSSQAENGLQKLAMILKSPVGAHYAVRIVGHTDNVPIGRPSTRAQHPTNWHLSVHRAISVKDVLVRAGVQPTRMGVEGYGEHRPIEPNGPKGNKANRRVEIYLTRGGATESGQGDTASGSTLPAPDETPGPKQQQSQPAAAPREAPDPGPTQPGAYK